MAHIDITRAPTVGHIWRYAGYDPTCEWKRGEKRPWNASLKVLCWKAGESFVKVSGKEEAFYGQIYKKQKEKYVAKNLAGGFAETAAATLKKKTWGRDTIARAAYESGRLPDGHIHAMAKRYAVKLFLAHLHDRWFRLHFGTEPPKPYPIAYLDHVHYIAPPE